MSSARDQHEIEALAMLFVERNYVPFVEIEEKLGIGLERVVYLKPALEHYMRMAEGGSPYINITSRIDLPNPGLFVED